MFKPKKLSKIILFVFIVVSLSTFVYAVTKQQAVQKLIVLGVQNFHFSPRDVDNSYSEMVFDLFINKLDPSKRFFTQEDIVDLSIYKHSIDDEINNGDFKFFNNALEIYLDRLEKFKVFYRDTLETPFTFDSTNQYESDPDKILFAKNYSDLKKRWSLFLEYKAINAYLNLKQDEVSKNIAISADFDTDLESKSREKIKTDFDKFFSTVDEEDYDDKLNFYLDTLVNVFDSHTGYFPAAKKEQFDINISGKLEGIGAELREENGYIKVVRIVYGSASYREGSLKPEDLILKVGQGNEEPVNTVGMKVSKIVQLIRGKKGTEVRLTVRHVNGEEEVISIIRDIVEIEETFTKTTIIKDPALDKRIGYIHVPKFYRDIQDNKARNTTDDVDLALRQLQDSNIDGIILDLRYNEGGFLLDAVNTAGLFIESGPVVQVKSRRPKNTRVLVDQNNSVTYSGPVIVLINPYSASASEILAAALQDYGRAIIVGTNSFGKGTVQQFIDLDNQINSVLNNLNKLGSLKVTIQKFYRINGGSTQSKGVIPDIDIPDAYSAVDIGENQLRNYLPWDTVESLPFNTWDNLESRISILKQNSADRIKQSHDFTLLIDQISYIQSINKKSLFPLNIDQAVDFKNDITKQNKAFDKQTFKNENIEFEAPSGLVIDQKTENTYKTLYKNLRSDLQLSEALHIINDYIEIDS